MTNSTPIRLHIGGQDPHPDWKILDVDARPEVDFVCNAADLSQFADGSVEAIYASHVLEHFHYQLGNELVNTLREWHRVLQPAGNLYISVPNLKTLCWLYLNPALETEDRHYLMQTIFGGQTDQFDLHRAGFDPEILAMYLEQAGFHAHQVVEEFNMFEDCSSLRLLDTLISLNAIATR